MLQSPLEAVKFLRCTIHKMEKATHICTDIQCCNNPTFCKYCFSDFNQRNMHAAHQYQIKPYVQGINIISTSIRNQIILAQQIYDRTIGAKQNQLLRINLEKGQAAYQQLETRMEDIKSNIDNLIEKLLTQFKKQIIAQKNELLRSIEEHRQQYLGFLDDFKQDSQQIIDFHRQIKYYSNPNTLQLKLAHIPQEKASQIFCGLKKILAKFINIPLGNIKYIEHLNENIIKIIKTAKNVIPSLITHQKSKEFSMRQIAKDAIVNYFSLDSSQNLLNYK